MADNRTEHEHNHCPAEVRDTNAGLRGKPEALLQDVLALTRSEAAREARRRLKAKRTMGGRTPDPDQITPDPWKVENR